MEVDLYSPHLDYFLHPSGSVRVQIEASPAGSKNAGGFALDAFHINSMVEYLRVHASCRGELEAKLMRDRIRYDANKEADRGDIWRHVNALVLMIGPPASTSEYTLTLKVTWDNEHQRWAQFRNGKCVHVSAE